MELYRDGDVVRLTGQVDGRCTAELRDAIHEHLDRCAGDLVLDLAEVESIDLIALRMLAVTSRDAGRAGHRVLLRGTPPMVRRLLHLTRLRPLVTYEPVPIAAG